MIKKAVGVLSLVLITFLIAVSPVSAAIFKTGQNMTLDSPVADNDLYISGGTVSVNKKVDGDVIAIGGMVRIDGEVTGDVIAAGGMVIINGDVGDDVRVGGVNVTINGRVDGDVIAGGGNLVVGKESIIGGSLIVNTGNAHLSGDVEKSLLGSTANLVLEGRVGQDVKVETESLALTSSAKIVGDLNYKSRREANIASGAQVLGKTVRTKPKLPPIKPSRVTLLDVLTGRLTAFFVGLVSLIIVTLIVVVLIPKKSQEIAETVQKTPWVSLGLGLILLLVVPLASVIIGMTLIGLPLAFILMAFFAVGVYLSKVFVGILVGQQIIKVVGQSGRAPLLWSALLGVVLIAIVAALPLVGFLTRLMCTVFGLGAIGYNLREIFIRKESSEVMAS